MEEGMQQRTTSAGRKKVIFEVPALGGERMSAMVSCVAPLVPAFPAGVDARWETENRTVWNEQEHANEERELVYEISWIAELGVWRLRNRATRAARSKAPYRC